MVGQRWLVALAYGLVALTCGPSRDARADEEPTRVFIFAGQSNMVGADADAVRIDDFPEFVGTGTPRDDVLFTVLPDGDGATPSTWGPLRPLHAFGPELTFAQRVTQEGVGPIAIIKAAVGGTTVAFDWNPDAPEKGQKLYPRTLRLIRESLAALDARGIRHRLEGVLWHQGENDMLDRTLCPQYAAGLERLIGRLRADLGAPQLTWYLAEVSEKGIWGMDHRGQLGMLRRQQDEVLQADPRTRFVPTSHLAFEVMGSGQPHYHFGTQGQLQLGEALAAAYLSEIGRVKPAPDRRLRDRLPFAAGAKVRLYVLAGQRTMEGEDAHVTEISSHPEFAALAHDQGTIPFRYALGGGVRKSSDWEPLGPVGFLGSFGPELSFGARIRATVPRDEGVGIVKFTDSGAQGPDWSPDGTEESHRALYDRFIEAVRSARDDLIGQGFDCRLEGIGWTTGENDSFFPPYAHHNAAAMQRLVERTRADLQVPHLRWVIAAQHEKSPWGNVAAVNAGLNDLARTDPDIVVVDTSHLPYLRAQYGTEGTLRLGETLADAFAEP